MSKLTIEQMARIVHETNRAYCQAIGDNSQPCWDDAPDWQKDSAIVGVQLHTYKPETSAEQSHVSWLAQKEADGWKYGPVKDAVKKEHPCYLPYDQLPVQQQVKDHLFKAVVTTLIESNK